MPTILGRAGVMLALAACASAPRPAEDERPKAEPSAEKAWYQDVSVVAPVEHTKRAGERNVPPTRRAREYLLSERDYGQLMKRFALGFSPDDCTSYCKQDTARQPTDDGGWVFVLRCLLKRNLRDEPVVACREEPTEPGRVPAPASKAIAGIGE